jgi:hypothetical protein
MQRFTRSLHFGHGVGVGVELDQAPFSPDALAPHRNESMTPATFEAFADAPASTIKRNSP